jgi:hypothetical protein
MPSEHSAVRHDFTPPAPGKPGTEGTASHRLAAAHPETADAVFRKILRKPDFTWAEHGEALLRRRKPWYYEHEPRPGFWVIGTRLTELAARR